MLIKLLAILAFFVSIWTQNYIVVRWDGIPAGDAQVFCTFDGVFSPGFTLELTRFTWVNDAQDGEWIAFHKFLEPVYLTNCMRFVDGDPVFGTASAIETFDSNLIFMPLVSK